MCVCVYVCSVLYKLFMILEKVRRNLTECVYDDVLEQRDYAVYAAIKVPSYM